jgi:hypothetical protein
MALQVSLEISQPVPHAGPKLQVRGAVLFPPTPRPQRVDGHTEELRRFQLVQNSFIAHLPSSLAISSGAGVTIAYGPQN